MIKYKSVYIATILAGILVGCGGGSSSATTGASNNKVTVYDDIVSGVKYVNGSNTGFTDSNGQFPYTSGGVEFFVGDVKLGTVTSMPVDNKIFIQDIVGVSRTDTSNTDVIKIGRFLQSLDSNSSTDAIEIIQTDFDKFEDANDKKQNIMDSNSIVDTILVNAGYSSNQIVSAEQAVEHITNVLESQGEIVNSTVLSLDTSNINNGDLNVELDPEFNLEFTDDIPKKYLNSTYFILTKDSDSSNVVVTIAKKGNRVLVEPTNDLEEGESYTLTIKNTIKNYSGDDINLGGNTDKVITFTTRSTPNVTPTANAGSDQTVTQGTAVTLNASASSDSDGSIASYSWSDGTNILSTNESFTKSDFSVGTHNLTLTVTDDNGASDTDNVTITVNKVLVANVAPTAKAGVDQTVTQGTAVTLDTSASSDSDGYIASYSWSDGTNVLSTNVSFTKSDFSVGTHKITLTVTDNDGATSTDTVTITVNAASSGGTSSNDFILKIDTEAFGNNSTNNFIVKSKTSNSSFNVDCDNDGTDEATAVSSQYTCSYTNDGVYDVRVSGTYGGLTFSSGDPKKITQIVKWGDNQWTNMSEMFYKASNLTTISSNAGVPDLSKVSSAYLMFGKASSFNADINSWDVSNIEDFNSMFSGATIFNQNIGNWNLTNAKYLAGMFNEARAFNQDIGSWNVSNVTNMSSMFMNARAFNQDIGSWNVSNVTNMSRMFDAAFAFNQDIGNWDVSNVTNMSNMFNSARAFNQDISSWDVSNVTNMSSMFYWAIVFNQDISSWDVSNVTNMFRLFSHANAFKQDIGGWDVSSATLMGEMFSFMYFNHDISSWDVSNVTNMAGMFSYNGMFNQDISSWQIQNVEKMQNMFKLNGTINQDFSAWYPRKNTNLDTTDMFDRARSMTQANIDAFLVGPTP